MTTLEDYMDKWRVIPLEKNNAYMNTALDEVAMNAAYRLDQPVLRFYEWWPQAISLGVSQTVNDFDQKKCNFYGFDLVRRETGGKATIHTANQDVCYTLAIPPSMFSERRLDITENYARFCSKLAGALTQIGLKDVRVNQNDIFTSNLKISGNAARNKLDSYMQHGFFFYNKPDIQLMLKLINKSAVQDWKELRGEEDITSISESTDTTKEELCRAITTNITGANYDESSWTEEELAEARELIKSKYKTQKWQNKGTQNKGLCYIIWD